MKWRNDKMTGTQVKKDITALKKSKDWKVLKISVSIGEEEENEFDVNVNVYFYDRWHNDEFECFTHTMEDEKKAEAKAKRIATTLENAGYKTQYTGFEDRI